MLSKLRAIVFTQNKKHKSINAQPPIPHLILWELFLIMQNPHIIPMGAYI